MNSKPKEQSSGSNNKIERRAMLKTAAAAAIFRPLAPSALSFGAQIVPPYTKQILSYIESHARPDGGYAWDDQPESHMSPTAAAIGCYKLLGQIVPRQKALAQFVHTNRTVRKNANPNRYAADLRDTLFEQIQSLRWLNEDVSRFNAQVGSWIKPSKYTTSYEVNGYPILRQEAMAFACRQLLGMPMDDISTETVDYFASRRRANGSFNNSPASDGTDGHVLNTWWGLAALRALKRDNEKRSETIAWLHACQLPVGGFTYQPKAEVGGIDDVLYMWAAIHSLNILGGVGAIPRTSVNYLLSLWNADGGFGDRPGLRSRPESTYLALDALNTLGALDKLNAAVKKRRPLHTAKPLPANLKLFTIQIEAHGQGSPQEAVELARDLRIHLWGAKNATLEWIKQAQAIADRERVRVKFFVSNEEYGTFVGLPGLGAYSHTSDIIAPADRDFGKSMAGKSQPPDWTIFRDRRVRQLEEASGRLIYQVVDNEEFARILFDDSVQRQGYAAISSFHFETNFISNQPFQMRYRHHLPFVALQDAHGDEAWWWTDRLVAYRTIFLATEPTWEAWLDAMKQQWVVAVRHDEVTGFRTQMLGGAPSVQDFLRRREPEWKWWGDKPEEIKRPLVSIVLVKPEDALEEGRPEQGVALRVRCWWRGHTRPTKQVVELVSLAVDNKRVEPRLVEKRDAKGMLTDHYYLHHLPTLDAGQHTATATVRMIESKSESQHTVELK